MAEFSLELNDDQKQIQSWVHDFAEQVIRPAGEEWDEREETPWPIIQEAAKIGLYSMDFMANALMGDPTGLTMPVAMEELFWGDAGIALSIFGSDRKSVVSGKSVSVRVDLGGRRIIKKKKNKLEAKKKSEKR